MTDNSSAGAINQYTGRREGCNALTLYIKRLMTTDKNGRRIGKRAYPLRKVVAENIPGEINGEKFNRLNRLECGHYVFRSSDIYGETSPTSQRCRQCYNDKQSKP